MVKSSEKILKLVEMNNCITIKELAERYATPIPQMSLEVDEIEKKVNAHLQKMGYTWN